MSPDRCNRQAGHCGQPDGVADTLPMPLADFLALLKTKPPPEIPIRLLSACVTTAGGKFTQYVFSCAQQDGKTILKCYKVKPPAKDTEETPPFVLRLATLFTIETDPANLLATLYTDVGAFQCRYETRFIPWAREWLFETLKDCSEDDVEIGQAKDNSFQLSIKRLPLMPGQIHGSIHLRLDSTLQLQNLRMVSTERHPKHTMLEHPDPSYQIAISPISEPDVVKELEKLLAQPDQTIHPPLYRLQ